MLNRRLNSAGFLSPRPGHHRRRATILIFTIGVLTLLALIGVGLLASVRAQRNRVQITRSAAAPDKLIDGVVEVVRERLREDLWGPPMAAPAFLAGATTKPTDDGRETVVDASQPGGMRGNEPFDAPGPFDRWLASTVPYRYDPNPDP